MRFVMLLKASADSEAGVMPGEDLVAGMMRFNEELVNAGALVAAEGLKPSSEGRRVTFDNGATTVTEGPFGDPGTLVAGFWLIEAASKDAALEWVQRCPIPEEDHAEIELRPVFGVEDFGDEATPELRQQEQELRAKSAERD